MLERLEDEDGVGKLQFALFRVKTLTPYSSTAAWNSIVATDLRSFHIGVKLLI